MNTGCAALDAALESHRKAGWRCHSGKRKRDDADAIQPQCMVAPPKASVSSAPVSGSNSTSEADMHAAALGLGTAPDACALWGVTGCSSLAAVDKTLTAHARALAHAMAAVSAARLAASAAADAGWCLAALTALKQAIQQLEAASLGGLGKVSRRAATAVQTTLKGHASVADSWLRPHATSGSRKLPQEAVVHVASALDGCYYALLEHFLTCGWPAPSVPPPHMYFPFITASAAGNNAACQGLLRKHPAARQLLLDTWDLSSSDSGRLQLPDDVASRNPLLAVMWARFQEGCRLLAGLDTMGSQDDVVDALGSNDGQPAPGGRWGTAPASDALRAWRAGTREVHVYAYAAPNAAAIAALVARSPLLEVGAGTGYWAAALRAAGADVLALDIAPPGPAASAANMYHGRIPTVTEVQHGGIAAAGRLPKRALLLSYPPPGDSMACDALRKYRGRCVCVVGEWDGDTADRHFTAALLAGWRLAQRVALPNWGDSAHELTIWERRQPEASSDKRLPSAESQAASAARSGGSGSDVRAAAAQNGSAEQQRQDSRCAAAGMDVPGSPLVECAVCEMPAATGSAADPPAAKQLRRCRHCRQVAFCSLACRKAGGKQHAELHALRLLFPAGRKLRFKSDADFEPLRLC